ncbi:unnamed protein product, partial [Allacma fusca]
MGIQSIFMGFTTHCCPVCIVAFLQSHACLLPSDPLQLTW